MLCLPISAPAETVDPLCLRTALRGSLALSDSGRRSLLSAVRTGERPAVSTRSGGPPLQRFVLTAKRLL